MVGQVLFDTRAKGRIDCSLINIAEAYSIQQYLEKPCQMMCICFVIIPTVVCVERPKNRVVFIIERDNANSCGTFTMLVNRKELKQS